MFQALARETDPRPDLSRWQALQTWLATGPRRVVIPFADQLAELVPPVAVRLRRDFKTVLMLIQAHALLHQASRVVDEQGRIVAAIDDYAQVRDLTAMLVAEGAEATVRREVREVVETVARLLHDGRTEVRQSDLTKALRLDKSVISRRVGCAVDGGVLRNLEDRRGRPARLVLGDPIPDDVEVLPRPERLHGCTVAQGDEHPSPPAVPAQLVARDAHMPRALNGGAHCCARCGAADRPDDPLVPFGIEPHHSWQHMACWHSAREAGCA